MVYELQNEPDHTDQFTGTVADMVALTQVEYDAIRAADPTALIGSPSGDPNNYMQQYWNAGGVQTVDLLTFHDYPDPTLSANDQTYPAAENVLYSSHREFQSGTTFASLAQTKPVWNTEGSSNLGATANQDQQSAFVARFYLMHWSNGISHLAWYAWDHTGLGTLWYNGAELKQANAYRQVYNWMVGATMPSACVQSGSATDIFRGGGQFECPLTS